MARIRTIKPEFFTSVTLSQLNFVCRLCFIGLWTHADDSGRAIDDARLIKAALFPLDDGVGVKTIEKMLTELADLGLIERYEVDNRRYLQVSTWKEHQRINRPNPSKLPPPPRESSPRTHGALNEDSVSAHGGLTVGKEQGRERKGTPPPPSVQPRGARPVAADGGGELISIADALRGGVA